MLYNERKIVPRRVAQPAFPMEKADGRDAGLEIEDKEGTGTIMRFES